MTRWANKSRSDRVGECLVAFLVIISIFTAVVMTVWFIGVLIMAPGWVLVSFIGAGSLVLASYLLARFFSWFGNWLSSKGYPW